jgi:hypothetical protein
MDYYTEINNNHNTRKLRCERYQPAQSKTGVNWFAPNVMQLLLHIIQSPFHGRIRSVSQVNSKETNIEIIAVVPGWLVSAFRYIPPKTF